MSVSGSMTPWMDQFQRWRLLFPRAKRGRPQLIYIVRARGYFVYDMMASVGPLSPNDLLETTLQKRPHHFFGGMGGATQLVRVLTVPLVGYRLDFSVATCWIWAGLVGKTTGRQ